MKHGKKVAEVRCDCGESVDVFYEDIVDDINFDILTRNTLHDKYKNKALMNIHKKYDFNDEKDIIVKDADFKHKLDLFLLNSNLTNEQEKELLTILNY